MLASLVLALLALGCRTTPEQDPREVPRETPSAEGPSTSTASAWGADSELVPLAAPRPITVDARPIPFHAEAPGVSTTGGIRCLAAFELRSSAVRFGGFSGLVILGDRLMAISDRGHWWTSPLALAADGRLEGLGPGLMGPIPDTDGRPVEGRRQHDAEDLVTWPGGFLLSYEGDHRLHFHPRSEEAGAEDGEIGSDPFGRAERWSVPEALKKVDENSGLEALVRLADGRLLIFEEDEQGTTGEHRAWVGRPGPEGAAAGSDARGTWEPLSVVLPSGLHPTAAAALPSGEVLLLERGWSPVDGVTIRLSTLRGPFRGGASPEAKELALMRPPLAVDNMEAMDVVVEPRGRTLIYLLSDDNYSADQRTILLQLELLDGMDPGPS